MLKEEIMAQFNDYPGICLEGMRILAEQLPNTNKRADAWASVPGALELSDIP
jgi:hypothetical protein